MRKGLILKRFIGNNSFITLSRLLYIIPMVTGLFLLVAAFDGQSLLSYAVSDNHASSGPQHEISTVPSSSSPLATTDSSQSPAKAAEDHVLGSSTAKPSGPTDTVAPSPTGVAQPPSPAIKPACSLNVTDLVNRYNSDVEKQKRTLIDQLSFLAGSLIHNVYIDTYNQAVVNLFKSYTAAAERSHCIFPPTNPLTLPYSYQP